MMSSNPFPGLRPFEQKETHLFFGRDGQSNELLKKLQESRFLALVGVSGSGKSSLVRAGLLSALYGGLMSSVESDWRIAVFRPGNDPIGNMARALITQAGFGGESGLGEVEVAVAETTLRRGNLGLLELVRQAKRKVRKNGRPFLGPNENVLLVVDQFEEIFRIIEQYDELVRVKQLSEGHADPADATITNGLDGHPREEAAAFVKLLLESTRKNKENKYDENIYIIVAMRSDYLGETAQFWGMPERINEGQYLIPRMTRDERRQAIVGPVAVAGGKIGEPLVNQLLNDAGENPGHLPILQHALMRMWELSSRSSRKNGGLNLNHYEQIGRLSGALSQHANEAFDELPPHLQTLAAKVFKCLTEKGLANREIRRPMTLADICNVVAADEKDVKLVVEVFRKEGRWFLTPAPTAKLEPDTLIDISHESLIPGWDKLTKWVNEEAESARTYKRLADTAILKERNEEDFYRGPALQLALKWRQENVPNPAWARRYHPEYKKAIDFLNSSLLDSEEKEKAEKDRISKELQRRRRYNIILGVLVILTVGSSIFGFTTQRRELNREKERVVTEEGLRKTAIMERATAEKERANAQAREREAVDLNTEAERLRKEAVATAEKLQIGLVKEQAALKLANDAKAVAIAERDKARRLQNENQEQATTYGYFKTAFDDVAAGNRDQAASSLRKALRYFEDKEKKALSDSERKENKANRISTHINIGDVYRTSTDQLRLLAAQEYDRAINLIGSSNNQLRASTSIKAGSVWKDSTNEREGRRAADYYEKAASLYRDIDQNLNASEAWLEAGKIHARFMKEESARSAEDDFDNAVSAHGDNKHRIASTSAQIGESYVQLLEDEAESDDEDEDPQTPEEPAERERQDAAQDRLRLAGAKFFRNSANAYDGLRDFKKAADMHQKAGLILSGSNSDGLLTVAALDFDSAASRHGQLGNVTKQRAVLLEAGNTFIKSETTFGRRLAEQFYQNVINLSGTSNEEKVEALKKIAEAYSSSADLNHKQKAVEYYQQVSLLYQNMNRKDDEIAALLDAGNVLRDLKDDASKTQTIQLYEQAVSVSENDPVKQAKILDSIGDLYQSSDEPYQKQQAITYYRRAANVAHQAGDRRYEVNALVAAGTVLLGLDLSGAQAEASRFFEEAVNVYEKDVPQQSALLSRIGSLYAAPAEPQKERALEYYQRAIVLAHQHNEKAAEVNALLAKARGVERLEGKPGQRQVDELYEQATAVYNDDPARQVDTLVRIGRLVLGPAKDAARIAMAEQYYATALNLAAKQQDKKIAAAAHLDIGLGYQLSIRERPKARSNYESALAIYEAEGDLYGQAMTLYRLTGVDRAQAQKLANRALALFVRVLPTVEASGNQKELADAFFALGSLHRLKKEYQASLDSYNRALAIYQTLPDQAARVSNTRSLIRTLQKRMEDAP